MDDLFARFEAIGRDLEARQSRPVEYERAAMESYMEALGPGDAPFLLPRAFNEVRQEYRATRNVPQIMAPSDLQTTNIFPRVVAFGPTTKPTTAIQHDSEDEEDDQETGGPESNQDSDLSANSVRWDGKIIAVADFLGDRWSRRILDMQQAPPIEQPDYLKIQLEEYQRKGVGMMLAALRSPVLGFLNADEVGLGKTIMSIVLAIEARSRGLLPDGLTVVVTPRQAIRQWEEQMTQHIKSDRRLRVVTLSTQHSRDCSSLWADRPDFILVTYHQLLAMHKRAWRIRDCHDIIAAGGLSTLLEDDNGFIKPSEDPTRYPDEVLYSDYWRINRRPFFVLLDEVNNIQREHGKTHKAVKDICKCAIGMLSGTPVPDNWTDLGGILDLYPGRTPFSTTQSLIKYFARPGKSFGPPTASRMSRLHKLLQVCAFSRPSDVLHLQPYLTYKVLYIVDGSLSDDIKQHVTGSRQPSGSGHGKGDTRSEHHVASLFSALRAQQLASCPRLAGHTTPAASSGPLPEDDSTDDKVVIDEHDAKSNSFIRGTRRQIKAFQQTERENDNLYVAKSSSLLDQTEPLFREDMEPTNDEIIENEDDSQEPRISLERETIDDMLQYGERRSRGEWITELKSWKDEDIFTPKISTILHLMTINWETYPREKTIIFSTFLRLLDVIEEAMVRDERFRDVHPFTFNGEQTNHERDASKSGFLANGDHRRPMLLSAEAGSAALNLQVASIQIHVEPWWCPNKMVQAIGRSHRKGQTKQVKIFRLICANSLVDAIITRASSRKEDVTSDIKRGLAWVYDKETKSLSPPAIPKILSGFDGFN